VSIFFRTLAIGSVPMGWLRLWLGVGLLASAASGCTVIVAGRNATADGNPMVAGTDDSGPSPNDIRLVKVPATQPKDSLRPVYPAHIHGYPRLVSTQRGPQYLPLPGQNLTRPLGYIKQVASTFGYFEGKYGLINDVGLAVAESTTSARTVGWPIGSPGGANLFGIMELLRVALERCATARCAVKTMGALAVQYGFCGDGTGTPAEPKYGGASESAALIDRGGEAWVFHVLTGPENRSAVWAAQRVRDNEVAAIPNGFVIRRMNLSDPDNFLASDNVQSFALKMEWWKPKNGPFDFTAAYGYFPPGPAESLGVGRRIWRIFDLLAPSLKLDMRLAYRQTPTYPFSVVPDKPVTLPFMRQILRDHFEGTILDLTKGLTAGPFGNPVRFGNSSLQPGGFERALSMYRALYSYISVVRLHKSPLLAGVLWFGYDAPHGTVYVPLYGTQSAVPVSFSRGIQSDFTSDSAFWAFSFVNNWLQLRYADMIGEIREEQNIWEALGVQQVARLDREVPKLPKNVDPVKYLTEQTGEFAEEVVKARWQIARHLVAKYSNGNILTGEGPHDLKSPGYPEAWLKQTQYPKWPGKTWLPDDEAVREATGRNGWFQDVLVLLIVAAAVLGVLYFWTRMGTGEYNSVQ